MYPPDSSWLHSRLSFQDATILILCYTLINPFFSFVCFWSLYNWLLRRYSTETGFFFSALFLVYLSCGTFIIFCYYNADMKILVFSGIHKELL